MSRVLRLLAAWALSAGVPVVLAPAADAAARTPSIVVTVEDVAPSVPAITAKPAAMTFSVRLTNSTDTAIAGLRLVAERDTPIVTQTKLNAALTNTAEPDDGLSVPPVGGDVEVASLPARGSVVLAYRITTGTVDGSVSLCLCDRIAQIYPIWFGAETTGSDGSASVLGGVRTFVPSMIGEPAPAPTRVAWLWPLIDRPHRLTSDTVFVDDDLAASVAPGGRLDRALQVVEGVGADTPITLVIDPELLDELSFMATGRYTVATAGGVVAGTGAAAAASWLGRLRDVLAGDPDVAITLTPPDDPDQQTLVDRNLRWATTMSSAMARRVTTALAGRSPTSDLAWPTGGALTGASLRALVRTGVSTLVLDQASFVKSQRRPSVTRVRVSSQDARAGAAVTSAVIQSAANSVITDDRAAYRQLPTLVAELAIRAVGSPAKAGFLAITPTRYVDPSPARAIRLIQATTTGLIADGQDLRSGIAQATTAGRFAKALPKTARLPSALTDAVADVDQHVTTLQAMFAPAAKPSPAALLNGFATARQRVLSAGFTSGSSGSDAALGTTLARRLDAATLTVLRGVHIVTPSSAGRSYTLASSDSRLPITVKNDLDYATVLRVDVDTVDNVSGFSTTPRTETVPAHSQVTFQIRATVNHPGVFHVEAQLSTPGDTHLGRPVRLTVHSTLLGKIGVIITAVAGGVLVIALLVRFGTQLRRRRQRRAAKQTRVLPEREPAA